MTAAHLNDNERARVRLTVSCRDSDLIPKVSDAGALRVAGNRSVQVMHCGVVIAEGEYYGGMMTEIIRQLQGHHEPQEELAFHVAVERLCSDTERPVMLELGSFWAYYSLWFLARAVDGRVICVEPDPAYLEVGRRNFALNSMQGTFIQAAVGASRADAVPFVCESDGVERSLPVESLASLLERQRLERVDMLFMDVQGAEWPFLESAGELVRKSTRFAFISTHHHSISGDHLTHQRCLEALQELGAHVFAEHTVAESFSGDGLIAASFDERDQDLSVDISRARAGESLFGDPLRELASAEHERGILAAQIASRGRSNATRRIMRRLRRIVRPSGAD